MFVIARLVSLFVLFNGLRAELRARLDDVLGDAGVDGDEVLAVLARLAPYP